MCGRLLIIDNCYEKYIFIITILLKLKEKKMSIGEASGIPSVAVKCVDIRRNTSGEGGLLDDN